MQFKVDIESRLRQADLRPTDASNRLQESLDRTNQHIMIDRLLLGRIVDYASVSRDDVVLEVGAGPGNLTQLLAGRAKAVYSYELDETRFGEELSALQRAHPHVNILFQNALSGVFPGFNKLVANIPYNISEPLLMKLLGYHPTLAVMTVGETFATLLTERSDNRLSIIAPAYFRTEIKEVVPRSAFDPPPRTESAVVMLTPRTKEELMETMELYVTRELWQQKTRKTRNALREALISAYGAKNKGRIFTKNQARDAIGGLSIDERILDRTIETLSGRELYDLVNECAGIAA